MKPDASSAYDAPSARASNGSALMSGRRKAGLHGRRVAEIRAAHGRLGEHARGRAGREHAAVFEHDDALGELRDEADPVLDQHDRDAARAQRGEPFAQRRQLVRVEPGRRFVDQQHARAQRQRARQFEPAPLREGQRRRERVPPVCERRVVQRSVGGVTPGRR
ncbi:hypothetical protein WL77_22035 [Burkholderia ubonensis]|nr:hypothetical protein WL77_22035 [Burkholderia ubonensis]KWE76541.1 hypothetical protein WL79_09760 [Burkholderia ubonensis]